MNNLNSKKQTLKSKKTTDIKSASKKISDTKSESKKVKDTKSESKKNSDKKKTVSSIKSTKKSGGHEGESMTGFALRKTDEALKARNARKAKIQHDIKNSIRIFIKNYIVEIKYFYGLNKNKNLNKTKEYIRVQYYREGKKTIIFKIPSDNDVEECVTALSEHTSIATSSYIGCIKGIEFNSNKYGTYCVDYKNLPEYFYVLTEEDKLNKYKDVKGENSDYYELNKNKDKYIKVLHESKKIKMNNTLPPPPVINNNHNRPTPPNTRNPNTPNTPHNNNHNRPTPPNTRNPNTPNTPPPTSPVNTIINNQSGGIGYGFSSGTENVEAKIKAVKSFVNNKIITIESYGDKYNLKVNKHNMLIYKDKNGILFFKIPHLDHTQKCIDYIVSKTTPATFGKCMTGHNIGKFCINYNDKFLSDYFEYYGSATGPYSSYSGKEIGTIVLGGKWNVNTRKPNNTRNNTTPRVNNTTPRVNNTPPRVNNTPPRVNNTTPPRNNTTPPNTRKPNNTPPPVNNTLNNAQKKALNNAQRNANPNKRVNTTPPVNNTHINNTTPPVNTTLKNAIPPVNTTPIPPRNNNRNPRPPNQ